MNHRYLRELKALNIRDVLNKPEHRKAMGLFKHSAYFNDRKQAEELNALVKFAYDNGYYKDVVIDASKHDWNKEHPVVKQSIEVEIINDWVWKKGK